MEKIYLKYYYDDNNIVECDFGNAWEILFLGPFYPLKKKNMGLFLIILILQILIIILFIYSLKIKLGLIFSLGMILLINLLFVFNYNMIVIEKLLKIGYVPLDYNASDKLIKKGIYFKLK